MTEKISACHSAVSIEIPPSVSLLSDASSGSGNAPPSDVAGPVWAGARPSLPSASSSRAAPVGLMNSHCPSHPILVNPVTLIGATGAVDGVTRWTGGEKEPSRPCLYLARSAAPGGLLTDK